MTNSATSRQWYDTTWLVVVLCIFIFPVGLYGLWKSQKFLKGWKIAGTALIALFIIALFSETSEAKEDSRSPAVLPPEASSPGKDTKKGKSYLFETPDNFKTAFNQYTGSNNLDFHITDLDVEEGEVKNIFQYRFSEHLGILGTVNKSDGGVEGITMLGAGDGTFKSGSNIIVCMIAIIAATDPDLTPEDRIDILKELGLMGNKDVDIMNLSTKTLRNGVSYSINSSKITGIIFGASRS